MLNIGVLVGGRSVEHEVAVITAMQMIENLDKDKYNVYPIYITNSGKWLVGDGLDKFSSYKEKNFENTKEVYFSPNYKDRTLYILKKESVPGGLFGKSKEVTTLEKYCTLDAVVLGLHGTNCEDGSIQGMLHTMGIPYTGGNVCASAVGMDKVLMKDVYKQNKIPVVNYKWFYRDAWISDRESVLKEIADLKYPLMVKPSNLGSSIGISKAKNESELVNAVEIAIRYDKKILIEEAVENLREINCAVLGYNDDVIASELEEPIGWKDVQSFENKYNKDSGTSRKLPADLSEDLKNEIQDYAKKAFKVINCSGTARVDFLLENDEKVYVNEINTLPGSTSYHLWEATGIKFKDLMDKLIEIAIKEFEDEDENMVEFKSDIFAKTSYGTKGGRITK